jgi:hypothetical protein
VAAGPESGDELALSLTKQQQKSQIRMIAGFAEVRENTLVVAA